MIQSLRNASINLVHIRRSRDIFLPKAHKISSKRFNACARQLRNIRALFRCKMASKLSHPKLCIRWWIRVRGKKKKKKNYGVNFLSALQVVNICLTLIRNKNKRTTLKLARVSFQRTFDHLRA